MALETFGELLTKYMRRIGMSDSELARKIGVQRQTIFRWREGIVKAPRSRDTVLDIAKALRLTPEEQDGLLLSAGFAPETLPELPAGDGLPEEIVGEDESELEPKEQFEDSSTLTEETNGDVGPIPEDASVVDSADVRPNPSISNDDASDIAPLQPPKTWRFLVSAAAILLIAILYFTFRSSSKPEATPEPTMLAEVATSLPESTATPVPTSTDHPRAICEPKSDNEILVLVARFKPYGRKRLNVAGRIVEALEDSIKKDAPDELLNTVRVELYDVEIADEDETVTLVQSEQCANAALLIWGQYDDGRVVAQMTSATKTASTKDDPRRQWPADLPNVFDADVPGEVRSLALEVLGVIFRSQRRYSAAASSFELALTPVADSPDSPKAEQRYNLYFYLGHALYTDGRQNSNSNRFSQAIEAYTKTMEVAEELERGNSERLYNNSALFYNRGIAYLDRYQNQPDDDVQKVDLDSAIEDLDAALQINRTYAPARVMRGNAYLGRSEDGDLEAAIRDYSAAIALAKDEPDSNHYFNRGLAHIQLNQVASWESDLDKALELGFNARSVYTAKCYARLRQVQAEEAKVACEDALEHEPKVADGAYVNYAISLAVVGDTENAITYLSQHVEWLNENGYYERYQGKLAEEWLNQLRAGEQPFDEEALRNLE